MLTNTECLMTTVGESRKTNWRTTPVAYVCRQNRGASRTLPYHAVGRSSLHATIESTTTFIVEACISSQLKFSIAPWCRVRPVLSNETEHRNFAMVGHEEQGSIILILRCVWQGVRSSLIGWQQGYQIMIAPDDWRSSLQCCHTASTVGLSAPT